MDWLMGKARGVNKTVNPGVPSDVAATSSSPGTSRTAVHSDTDTRLRSPAGLGSQSPQLANSPVGRDSPPNLQLQSSAGSAVQSHFQSSPPATSNGVDGDNFIGFDHAPFLKDVNLSQQLSLVAGSSFSTDFPALVEPFPMMDRNEWLAAHAIALFDNMSTMFDALYELCTCQSLSTNEGTGTSVYLQGSTATTPTAFADEERNKRFKGFTASSASSGCLSARQAIDNALTSCQDLIQSSKIFPVKYGEQFPSDLPQHVSTICKNLLVCITHLYHSHFSHLECLELLPHMNTLAKHFFSFTTQFNLIDDKEFGPLQGLHRALLTVEAPLPSNHAIPTKTVDDVPNS